MKQALIDSRDFRRDSIERVSPLAMTGNTYCGNLLWQSGLTLFAPEYKSRDVVVKICCCGSDPSGQSPDFMDKEEDINNFMEGLGK